MIMMRKAADILPIFFSQKFYGFNETSKKMKIEKFDQQLKFTVVYVNSHKPKPIIARTHMET